MNGPDDPNPAGSELGWDDTDRDPWGRVWGDPWYGVDPAQQNFGTPWAPGYIPKAGEGDPAHNPNFVAAPKNNPPPPTPPTPNPAAPTTRLSDFAAFTPPTFTPPPAFSYGDFAAPTLEEAQNEPGYDFAAKEGVKRLENTKAAQGTYRTGGTLKDIYAWANQFATQNYGNVYNRSANTYSLNRNNAADNYMTNYGVSRDAFDRDYRGSFDTYNFANGNNQLDFAREWDQFLSQQDLLKTIYSAGAA